MNTAFSFGSLSSTFKHLANYTAPGGKTVLGKNDSHDGTAKSSYRLIRDEFTLSDPGRLAYEKHVNQKGRSENLPTKETTGSKQQAIGTGEKVDAPPASIGNCGLSSTTSSTIDSTALAEALKNDRTVELATFNNQLMGMLQEVGIEVNGTDEWEMSIVFCQDAEGNIFIKSDELNAEQREQLEKMINDTPEMVERIRTLSANMQIVDALENDIDLADNSLAWARNQLLANASGLEPEILQYIKSLEKSEFSSKGEEQLQEQGKGISDSNDSDTFKAWSVDIRQIVTSQLASSRSDTDSASNQTRAETFLTKLGNLFGLSGTFTNGTSLLSEIDRLIDNESKELTKSLSSKLKEAGMGDITKKITFAEDKNGNIVIEGNVSAKQKKELAKLINDDTKLVEQIKTQKARMELAEGLREINPEIRVVKNGGAVIEHIWEIDVFNDKKYDNARTQLLKNVLEQSGSSLDELDRNRLLTSEEHRGDKHASLNNLLASSPEIQEEILAYLDRRDANAAEAKAMAKLEAQMPGSKTEKLPAVRELLSMKRGELTEATGKTRDFGAELSAWRGIMFNLLESADGGSDGYNTSMRKSGQWDWAITDFDMEIDHAGRTRYTNVKTASGCADSIRAAEAHLNTVFTDSKPSEFGLAILDAHDDYHGDVKEFKHKVVSDSSGYRVESVEADEAALREMEALTKDIGAALGTFFGEAGIKNPFAISFGKDGMLSLDERSLSSIESQAVKNVVEQLNSYLTAERDGEDTEGMLTGELSNIGKKILELKEVQEKMHDKTLLKDIGWHFASKD